MPRALSTASILTALVAASTSLACTTARATAPMPVRFAVSLDAGAFQPGTTVEVSVWNAAKLAARAKAGACVASADADGEQISCPPGVTYRPPPEPERFTFTVAEIAHGFRIAALSVRPGEAFELAIGGLAADGCNSAGASARGVAQAGELVFDDLDVFQTTMACVDPT